MSTDNNVGKLLRSGDLIKVAEESIAAGASGTSIFLVLDPTRSSSILVRKNGSTGTVNVTNTLLDDLEDSAAIYAERNSGTDDYVAGDTKGITGVKVVSGTPQASAINISVLQYRNNR